MGNLEGLLRANYYGIKDPSIMDSVDRFRQRYPDPRELGDSCTVPLSVMKGITKIVCNFMDGNGLPPQELPTEILEWTYAMGEAGIRRIDGRVFSGDDLQVNETDIKKMHSHFYSHNSDILRIIAGRTSNHKEKIGRLKEAYRARERSAAIAEEADPEHAAHMYSFMADMAKNILELETDDASREFWLRQAYHCIDESISRSGFDPKACAYRHSSKAGIALLMADNVKGTERQKIERLKEAFEAYSEAAIQTEFDPKHCAYQYSIRGQIAWRLARDFKISEEQKKKFLMLALESHNEAAKRFEPGSEQYASELTTRGRVKTVMAEYSDDKISVITEAYEDLAAAIELWQRLGSDKKQNAIAVTYSYKATAACRLASLCAAQHDEQSAMQWLQTARDANTRILELGGEIERSQMGYRNGDMESTLQKVAEIVQPEKKEELLHEAFQNGREAYRVLKDTNKRHAAMCALNAGKAAHKLYQMTEADEDKDNAVWMYSVFRKWFEGAHEEELRPLDKKVRCLVDELKAEKPVHEPEKEKKRRKIKGRKPGRRKHEEDWEE